jgi:signal peptidase II
VPISVVERSLGASPFHWLGLVSVAVAAVVADQLTKSIVISELGLGESVRVVGGFEIHHVYNTGIAFGFLGGWAAPVTILTAVAVVWMLGFFARAGARHPVLPVALGLLIGGALSNLLDRVRLGHVTDFLDPPYWPAFNLADTFICTGVAILLLALAGAEREPFFRSRSTPKGV